jgi:transcriptional regulator with XRE-family HTH domain
MCTSEVQLGISAGEGSPCILEGVATRERRLDRANLRIRRALAAMGDELREARLQAGLTQGEAGALIGLSHTHVGRIERGVVDGVPYAVLVRLGAVLGRDVPLRAYPNGDPVRDAAQLALLARFRALLPPTLKHRTEVPLGIPGRPAGLG